MSFIYAYILAVVMLLGGNHGHTDVLDAVAADVYWQAKGVTPELAQLEKDAQPDAPPANFDDLVKRLQSDDFATRDKARKELERMGPAILPELKPLVHAPDAEVAAVATDLVKRFSEHGQERAIRRLMAIRTLGEHKEKEALPLLKTLTDSKELFVGEYAQRAVAQINGEPFTLVDSSKAMELDLGLLPADTALVAQSRGIATEQLTVADIVDRALARPPVAPGMPGAPARLPDRKQMIQDASNKVLSFVERVGDLQIDGVTAGFTTKKGNERWATLIVRGKYDASLVYNAACDALGERAKAAPAVKAGDIPMLSIEDGETEETLLFPDNDRLVLIVAPDPDVMATDIRTALVASLKTGKGTLADNKELAEVIKTVDIKSPAWMAAKLTDAMATDIFSGLKTLTLNSKVTQDGVAFNFTGTGSDEKEVKAAAQAIDAGIAAALPAVQAEALRRPSMKLTADLMASIKISAEGKSATLSGELKAKVPDLLEQLGIEGILVAEPAQAGGLNEVVQPPPDLPK